MDTLLWMLAYMAAAWGVVLGWSLLWLLWKVARIPARIRLMRRRKRSQPIPIYLPSVETVYSGKSLIGALNRKNAEIVREQALTAQYEQRLLHWHREYNNLYVECERLRRKLRVNAK